MLVHSIIFGKTETQIWEINDLLMHLPNYKLVHWLMLVIFELSNS